MNVSRRPDEFGQDQPAHVPFIDEDLTFGIDLGIASCGWAVIRQNEAGGEIEKLGVWMFDAPETAKERTPTNQLRRQNRGMRRMRRRR